MSDPVRANAVAAPTMTDRDYKGNLPNAVLRSNRELLNAAYAGQIDGTPDEKVLAGGFDGIPRLYQVFRTREREMNQADHNLIRALEPQPGPIMCGAWSPDGQLLAVGGQGSLVNIYRAETGDKLASFPGGGPVFTVAFSPDGQRVAAAGYDGNVRVFDLQQRKVAVTFLPVPVSGRRTASR
jgi:WD40 repeat protein